MEKLKETKRNLDEAYLELDRLENKIAKLHKLLLKQLVKEVTKNGLQLTKEQCYGLGVGVWEVFEFSCCENQILVAYENLRWSPFDRSPGKAKAFLCVTCGKRSQRKQVCPHYGKDSELMETWEEIR